jgi:DNA polymerase
VRESAAESIPDRGAPEDLSGHPFVGPAGKLLVKALAEAGIDRSKVYVTNVVKHFKWEPRGKRRIHKKPGAGRLRRAVHGWILR